MTISLFFLGYILLGFMAGFLSGLLGIGSGLIIVPALLYLFESQVMSGPLMHMATATSLTSMILVTAASAFAHWRKGSIDFLIWRGIVPGSFFGVICGASIADLLPANDLENAFGCFMIFSAYRMFAGAKQPIASSPKRYAFWVQLAFGFIAGTVTGVLGIGGGVLVVPFILKQQLPSKIASGTAVACAFPTVVIGAITTMLTGSNEVGLPLHTVGYVFYPAALTVGLASIFTARFGTHLAHRLPTQTIKQLFAILMAVIGAEMLFLR